MLSKSNTILNLVASKLVAVVRGNSKAQAIKTAQACIDGGIKAIELTFTAPQADIAIAELSAQYQDDSEVIVGAGTVLDATTARIAIMAGAKFVVSPAFSEEVAKLCNLYGIPYLPGCMTVTEMQTALSYGAEVIKMFPGGVLQSHMIKDVHGPLPQVNLMVTGGVNLDNLNDWFTAGAVCVGIGGSLTGPAKTGDYEQVTKNAQKFVQQLG